MASSNDRVVVGALYGPEVCVDCDVWTGFAYVYRRDGALWLQEARLSPSDGTLIDAFGSSVSADGDYVVASALGSRSAYVFRREGMDWLEDAKLVPEDVPTENFFGLPVSISGDVVVVGDRWDNGQRGAAYVFRRSGTDWVQEAKLIASDAAPGGSFGESLSISGDYVLVGARNADYVEISSGVAYVFRHKGSNWVEEAKLIGSDTAAGDRFGSSVVLSERRALIGAPYHDDPATNTGAAYVFRRDAPKWVQEAKLTPGEAGEGGLIGQSLALNRDYALLGDSRDDDLGIESGAVYVFKRLETNWVEAAKLTPADLAFGDKFGAYLAIDDDHVLVASPGDDHTEDTSGSVYVYAVHGPCRSLADYAEFQKCFSGDGGGVPSSCETFDTEPDGDIDLNDLVQFLRTFGGP